MGVQISKSSATAPEFEDGVVDARIDSIETEAHPEWATENGKYGKDDGNRIAFNFTVMDGNDPKTAQPIGIEGKDGDIVDFHVNSLTSTAMGKNSRFTANMAGILTTTEKALIDAGETIDSDAINGRFVQLVLSHKENGWPAIDAIIPAKKVK